MNERDYERRLQRCLDERRDPLDDAELVEFAGQEPARIERLATLRARLSQLSRLAQLPAVVAPPAAVPSRRSWRWWVVAGSLTAAAAVVAAGLLTRLSLRGIVVPAPVAAVRGAIVSAELQEIRPWARSTAQFTVREVLASGASVQFETFEQRSAVR